MEFKELLEFIEKENKRIKNLYSIDGEKMTLAQTVKLSEEVGELSSEVLAHNSLQRSKKLENHDKGNIQGEFADVIFTTLILAKTMDVDIEKALKDKIEKIDKRY